MSGFMEKAREALNTGKAEKTDTYTFSCNQCGKCCEKNTGILLTPKDIFGIAYKMNIPVDDIINVYCDRYIGSGSKLPVITIRKGKCPFLFDTGCMLGGFKPTICKMYPLGRGFDVKNKTIQYFMQSVACGNRNGTETVDAWLTKCGITDFDEEFSLKWYELLEKLAGFMIKHKFPAGELEIFQQALYILIYLCYDIKKDFYKQFETRIECINAMIKTLCD